jgi:glucose-6-phosphate 1-dehydrogenase
MTAITDLAEALAPEPRSTLSAAEPCAIVIFGASGDLTRRKLIPALFELAAHRCLARRFAILGFARTPMNDEAFRKSAAESLQSHDGAAGNDRDALPAFLNSFAYVAGDYGEPAAFRKLEQRLKELDRQHNLHGNRLFYLATPPQVYPAVIQAIGRAGLAKPLDHGEYDGQSEKPWTRIIVEKPYGRDLASARELNRTVLAVFDESQVYRIDHFLGKETVQNLFVLRFGNGIFEPLWNRNYVDHVQITAAEQLGVENRAEFYETAGAVRDMIQSHVLQLLALVALEPPAAFDATDLRNEKIKVLQAIRPLTRESVERNIMPGQYTAGTIDKKPVAGYRQEPGVDAHSTTETFAALKLDIDNWRWADVPFYLRTGKRMARGITEIAIQFRRAPHMVFRGQGMNPNALVLNIQPDEGISICFHAKLPGQQMRLKQVAMEFRYRDAFGGDQRSAYATLINDCMRGDATLFDRADGVEAAWALVDPILQLWRDGASSVPAYPAGSWGPREADELLERDGRSWRKP